MINELLTVKFVYLSKKMTSGYIIIIVDKKYSKLYY